jgi:hypothetical protein
MGRKIKGPARNRKQSTWGDGSRKGLSRGLGISSDEGKKGSRIGIARQTDRPGEKWQTTSGKGRVLVLACRPRRWDGEEGVLRFASAGAHGQGEKWVDDRQRVHGPRAAPIPPGPRCSNPGPGLRCFSCCEDAPVARLIGAVREHDKTPLLSTSSSSALHRRGVAGLRIRRRCWLLVFDGGQRPSLLLVHSLSIHQLSTYYYLSIASDSPHPPPARTALALPQRPVWRRRIGHDDRLSICCRIPSSHTASPSWPSKPSNHHHHDHCRG